MYWEGVDGDVPAASWSLLRPTCALCQLLRTTIIALGCMLWLLCRGPLWSFESHEVDKLARYAMARKEYLTKAAERVLRRAAQYLSSLQISLEKVVAQTTCEPIALGNNFRLCAPAFLE